MIYYNRGCITRHILPSKINRNGVRVYIPLKGVKNGRQWVKPFVIETLAPVVDYPLLVSFDQHVFMTFGFHYARYVMTAPFSLAMLRHYGRIVAQSGLSRAAITAKEPVQGMLSPEQMTLYMDNYIPGDKEHNARLIYNLLGGIVTPL